MEEKIFWISGRPTTEGRYLIQDENQNVDISYFYENGSIFRYEIEGGDKVVSYANVPKGSKKTT